MRSTSAPSPCHPSCDECSEKDSVADEDLITTEYENLEYGVPMSIRSRLEEALAPSPMLEKMREDLGYPREPDMVNHPPHYQNTDVFCPQCDHELEVIDCIEPFIGNRYAAMKYLFRAGRKGEMKDEIRDLKKAAWHCTREAERMQKVYDAVFCDGEE